MRKKNSLMVGILLSITFVASGMNNGADSIKKQKISTNKDKLLTIAVQGSRT
jgi:hypothetical protein